MKGTRYSRALLVVIAGIAVPNLSSALPWSKDMRDQPSVKPQETEVELNDSSVPSDGGDLYRAPKDMGELVRMRLEAGRLSNPMPRSAESVNRGKVLYDIHCAICHGTQGLGDGPVGKKYIPDPMNLTIDYVQLQPDGQLYYTISHGSIAMPFYRDSISKQERWHVINYIKEVLRPESE
jgi:S-disulfanyl-L-cysteine oxidoreductase SoxD